MSTLNSENLRLHATMLSLYAELKREREKTVQAMAMLERSTVCAIPALAELITDLPVRADARPRTGIW